MAFEIAKSFVIDAPAEKVWAFLVDPRQVASCLPGAAIAEQLDPRTWSGTMKVKVGPVASSYRGKVVFDRLDQSGRRAEIVATGQDTKGKGTADLRLTSTVKERGPSSTEVTTVSRVSITGILAQMGRGMIEDVGDQMFQVFAQRMRAALEAPPSPRSSAGSGETAPATDVARARGGASAEALDLGSIGARAALRRPGTWIAFGLLVLGMYLLLRR